MQLDAQVKLETEDGTWSYEASFLTASGPRYELGGRAIDPEGRELQIILDEGESRDGSITWMRIDQSEITSTYCAIMSAGTGGGEP